MTKTMTMDKIATGSVQWNSKDAKAFRAMMAKYDNAKHSIKDNAGLAHDEIVAKTGMINTNRALIEKLNNGQSIIGNKTVADLESEIALYESEIEIKRNDKKEYTDKMVGDTDAAINMLKKYCSKKEYESADADFLRIVFAQMLADNGITPAMDTINILVSVRGEKENNSDRSAETNRLNGFITYNSWLKLSMNKIADLMKDADCLPTFKYTYVPRSQRKKDNK